jgi:hypothetical protein
VEDEANGGRAPIRGTRREVMSRKSLIRPAFVLLIVILLVTPSSSFAGPLRGESRVSELFSPLRQWVVMLWSWYMPATKAGCAIGPDGQPRCS